MNAFVETQERQDLRAAVSRLADGYGWEYFSTQARSGGTTEKLWKEIGRAGYIGVAVPEEFGGGGGGIGDLAAVVEELAAKGCPLLMLVVSPAICGSIIARFGTDEQRQQWLPGIADGSTIMAFAITEPDAGSNSHEIVTTAERDGDGWVLRGTKTYISGVNEADAILVVARIKDHERGKLRPALFVVPTDAPGLEMHQLDMAFESPEKQFTLFFDDIRLPGDALVGEEGAGLLQLFAGLNPERIMAAAHTIGVGRLAVARASEYARTREVWGEPIGAHQAISHPLAVSKVEIELTRLMIQKAAALYDAGDDFGAGEAANMAKYAAGEASSRAVDHALQTHGGSAFLTETGMAAMLVASRVGRIAPVSREMILNFVAQHSLKLPRSYGRKAEASRKAETT